MFERYLTDALTTHFGHFVENLDSDKVRLSAWNGELVLKDLTLRPDALDHLLPDCPVELAYGHVGNLELRIPWSLFRSQLKRGHQSKYISTTAPCSIILSDVNILIAPRRRQYDEGECAREGDRANAEDTDLRRVKKEKTIQAMMDAHLLERVTDSTLSTSNSSWIRDWLSALLSTLSVTIKDIHIRYEDPGSCVGFVWSTSTSATTSTNARDFSKSSQQYRPPFALGLILRQFSIQVDEEKSESDNGIKNSQANIAHPRQDNAVVSSHKVASAERLAIYWDSDCHLMVVNAYKDNQKHRKKVVAHIQSAFQVVNSVLLNSENNFNQTESSLEHKQLYQGDHSFVLDPISPIVKLTIAGRRNTTKSSGEHNMNSEPVESSEDLDIDGGSSSDASKSELEPLNLEPLPPSAIKVCLPPCKFTLDRSVLEDITYLRKSLALWAHASQGMLSESTLRRLAKLRPSESPGDDPKSWWMYCVEATLTLSHMDMHAEPFTPYNRNKTIPRKRGWRGFLRAFRQRKQYVALCLKLITPESGGLVQSSADNIHEQLLEMEDSLTPREVMAFRLALFESLDMTGDNIKLLETSDARARLANQDTKKWGLWSNSDSRKTNRKMHASANQMLSLPHRLSMLQEMLQALERERSNVEKNEENENLLMRPSSIEDTDVAMIVNQNEDAANSIVWEASIVCKAIALKINDVSFRKGIKEKSPILRFVCAWVQEHVLYYDESWDLEASLCSIAVQDLTFTTPNQMNVNFPKLIGRKRSLKEDTSNVEYIEGEKVSKDISISIKRKLHWARDAVNRHHRDFDRGSTTTNRIRIMPMEVVYSTIPVEATTRVLGTVKTTELLDDYHRMAAAAHSWQQGQRKKLFAALAHKRKKIIVDFDVGAPELLIPEDIRNSNSPMLAIDLGHLRLCNDDSGVEESIFDDRWLFVVRDIQVRSATVAAFAQSSLGNEQFPIKPQLIRKLVEPFTLEFAISTKIASEKPTELSDQSKFHIEAKLPRLAFNLNSSSIRLVSRLQNQFEKRRKQHSTIIRPPGILAINKNRTHGEPMIKKLEISSERQGVHSTKQLKVVQFDFSAPFVSLRLDSDTDDFYKPSMSTSFGGVSMTPLLDFRFRGIWGRLLHEVGNGGNVSTTFDAKLHSIGALDLFQSAGEEFALLLSSRTYKEFDELAGNEGRFSWKDETPESISVSDGTDLVTIQYAASVGPKESAPDKLAIGFHELYVEWNPETLASIQKAIRIPATDHCGHSKDCVISDSSSDDEFFDAVEEDEIDDLSLLSEVGSSSFETAGNILGGSLHSQHSSWSPSILSLARSLSGTSVFSQDNHTHASIAPLSPHISSYPRGDTTGTISDNPGNFTPQHKGFELTFELSKLRVGFNKDRRHRKVLIAQMDGTTISYKTRSSGGSSTKMKIGNLVFTDPSVTSNSTLYGEIMGLKVNDLSQRQPSSMLEMDIQINPRSRTFKTGLNPEGDDPKATVAIDRDNGVVNGSNNFVKAKFSPMRFVFLEQLWFEVIDYFFEGVIGNAVWGDQSKAQSQEIDPSKQVASDGRYLLGSDAKGFNFTRFQIELVSPELLFPVTYQSPHFLRCVLNGIQVSNIYNTSVIDERTNPETRMQWFNNCEITLECLRLFSWNGQELTKNEVGAEIKIRWPTGPSAQLISPKWNVHCHFNNLDLKLRKTDYALMQQIIAANIGEPSRHLVEWEALQNLSFAELNALNRLTLVHFGYDKKNVTPTTYTLTILMPCVNVDCIESDTEKKSVPVAIARCIDLRWNLFKGADLVVKQRITFDIDLLSPLATFTAEKLLSTWKNEDGDSTTDAEDVPELTYTSTTLPNGDNTKTLQIVDACIYADIVAWNRLSSFFSSLPGMTLFDEGEIASSIQVGDRWYKIGISQTEHPKDQSLKTEFSWIKSFSNTKHQTPQSDSEKKSFMEVHNPTLQFRVALTSPRIILTSNRQETSIARLVLRMSHLDFLQTKKDGNKQLARSFFFDEVELYTTLDKTKNDHQHDESLIHPWSLGGMIEAYHGTNGVFEKQSTKICSEILQARATYSDLIIAIDVCSSLLRTTKMGGTQSLSTASGNASNKKQSLDLDQDKRSSTPKITTFEVEVDGIQALVADDSGRHFAKNQNMISLSLGKVNFRHRDKHGQPSETFLTIDGFNIIDCLQNANSPFKIVASTRHGVGQMPKSTAADLDDTTFKHDASNKKLLWHECHVVQQDSLTFAISPALLLRLQDLSSYTFTAAEDDVNSMQNSILISRVSTPGIKQQFSVRMHSFSIQWNPSTVIAIQRFLGRLRKESRSKITNVFRGNDTQTFGKNHVAGMGTIPDEKDIPIPNGSTEVSVSLKEMVIYLNKEHQNRRLIEIRLSRCGLNLETSRNGMLLAAHVGDLAAWDSDIYASGICDEARNFVKVLSKTKSASSIGTESSHFLTLNYETFKGVDKGISSSLPVWVHSHVTKIDGIDDFLSIKVAATEFTYLKERTEELRDYLSNGLPGKGMGVTTRAAKGFISKRILSKSFLELQIESPQVFAPQHERSQNGLKMKLGDVRIQSFFELDKRIQRNSKKTVKEWWRILSLDLKGFQLGIKEASMFLPATNSIDLKISLRKPTSGVGGEISINGKLSFLDLELKYTDYILLQYTIHDNLCKKVNTDKWDNIEKAYWSEEAREAAGLHKALGNNRSKEEKQSHVAYASNARFIRYGNAGKQKIKFAQNEEIRNESDGLAESSYNSSIDVNFILDGFSLKLSRDDPIEELNEDDAHSAFFYDIILLRVEIVELSLTANESNDVSFHLSLFRLGLFDLGDRGRRLREQYLFLSEKKAKGKKRKVKRPRLPCPFFIIVEGYASERQKRRVDQSGEPQLVVTIERRRASSAGTDLELPPNARVTIARIVVNYLSLNVMIRPLKEALSFITNEWKISKYAQYEAVTGKLDDDDRIAKEQTLTLTAPQHSEGFQLKLVAHYPRIFFLADESDEHSRALVLRGLAVVNVNKVMKAGSGDSTFVLSADAQLQRMESYINADVHRALVFKDQHAVMVGPTNAHHFPKPENDLESTESFSDSLGIALIQPVTAGIELSETRQALFPTKRSAFVSIDPVSTQLSFDDLTLIETVLSRLSAGKSTEVPKESNDVHSSLVVEGEHLSPMIHNSAINDQSTFEVIFETSRLGLGLRTSDAGTVVSSIQNEAEKHAVVVGDLLVAIGGEYCQGWTLTKVVERLSSAGRPISLTFYRPNKKALPEQIPFSMDETFIPTANIRGSTKTAFSFTSFTHEFKCGVTNGLKLQRSDCWDLPVVMEVDYKNFEKALGLKKDTSVDEIGIEIDAKTLQVPRIGAVVAEVNGLSVKELGIEEMWLQLSNLSKTSSGKNDGINVTKLDFYRLTFLEIDSRLWGNIESVVVSSSGFNLSFIDDLHGRDMPLFRSKVECLELHAKRGIGGSSQMIEVQAPTIIDIGNAGQSEADTIMLMIDQVNDIKSDSVVTFSGIATCTVDYFHPRVAVWEPFIEPSQLFFVYEKQNGSIKALRPGQVAVELSDRMLREDNFGLNATIAGSASKLVTLNLSDACTEVAVKAIHEWKEWRKTKSILSEEANDDDFDRDETVSSTFDSTGFEKVNDVSLITKAEKDEIQPQLVSQEVSDEASNSRGVKHAAARRAAQAALIFAKKRGADSNKKGESAKPFVLRNRIGVSIAFVQEDSTEDPKRSDKSKTLSAVGEYSGLSATSSTTISEVSDKEDARFSMDILSNALENEKTTHTVSHKVRNYEGRFPSLTIAIQAVSGVNVDLLKNLQVFKVGTTVRHLVVRKQKNKHTSTDSRDWIEYSIPIVWKVEIEDNRRVLTLSTAVSVLTTAFDSDIEIGVRRINFDSDSKRDFDTVTEITSIGGVSPGQPFYLPLWVALKLEAVSIFVRPKMKLAGNQCHWGASSILRFAPLMRCETDAHKHVSGEKWIWEETFEQLDYICCESIFEDKSPTWLAVFSGSEMYERNQQKSGKDVIQFEEEHDLISVVIDSNFTLRNMLPIDIDWQIAHLELNSPTPRILDGFPDTLLERHQQHDSLDARTSPLRRGECTEVYACDYHSSTLRARFKELAGTQWSTWGNLSLDENAEIDGEITALSALPNAKQINIQVADDCLGVPLTFGVRIVPKTTFGIFGDSSSAQVYGIEVTVFAELWIRNLTSLPLNFGCPSFQLHRTGDTAADELNERVTRFNAETALTEIASLFEVGDKGTGIEKNRKFGGTTVPGDIESLPNQACTELWEEVFEYIEIEYSTIKRRWWASEKFSSFRSNITQAREHKSWNWIGEGWAIDTSGEVDIDLGAWESCRNLRANDAGFTATRSFQGDHSIRRRRYFRNRTGQNMHGSLSGGLQVFHQPLNDAFTREQRNMLRSKRNGKVRKYEEKDSGVDDPEYQIKIAAKCGDGKWSQPVNIPGNGTAHGSFRLLASRWPALASGSSASARHLAGNTDFSNNELDVGGNTFRFENPDLSSRLSELCFTVSDVDGEWGEFSRVMQVSPRFIIRNDSTEFAFEVKQAGAHDSSSLKLAPGAMEQFYWDDFRLPGLVCVLPCIYDEDGRNQYRWSGGFDINTLGIIPLRVRPRLEVDTQAGATLSSIRALVEIRPGTGGFGINVGFKEEDPADSLFRIENRSPFPIWMSQDGVLANPYHDHKFSGLKEKVHVDGDKVKAMENSVFALDVPYRQGKYAHRKAATLFELLRVRLALAPFTHRAGVETVKVLNIPNVGEVVYLNPSKLFGMLDDALLSKFQNTRIMGMVCSDGPTRVLRLHLVLVNSQDIFGNTITSYATQPNGSAGAPSSRHGHDLLTAEVNHSAGLAMKLVMSGKLKSAEETRRQAFLEPLERRIENEKASSKEYHEMDFIYSFRVEFSGFLFSMIDSVPSEIAVATFRNFNLLARWNKQRTTEASIIVSVGRLQVDNHIPSAPFQVAIRPDSSISGEHMTESDSESEYGEETNKNPLLMVALAFAPKHQSGIVCLRSVTVAPRNMIIAVDLAFLVRLQRYALGLQNHFRSTFSGSCLSTAITMLADGEQKHNIPFPNFDSVGEELNRAAAFGTENQKLYFQGLTILPASITLSVAPARALTLGQARLEGKEVAAIHQAVRKGDVLVGSSSALLGVRVGRTNTTPLAVVRGVFKSIVVDALLRLDGASLQFSGVSLQNHISTGPQLGTYLATHYLTSLRQNVPALLGSLAAFGNPLGLIRGLGDGMNDFVNQPVKGLKKSMQELDPTYLVDGVARGTGSLARHAVGGFADSASLLTETFSKNMTILTLDRRYAQRRDRSTQLRLGTDTTATIAGGVESGFIKLLEGFMEGVTGVVKAPIRGAEKKGIEGFAKGVGKGLLGLLVKPIIGISDAATDVMIGVRNSVENAGSDQHILTLDRRQFRPRRTMYGPDKVMRPYRIEDAAAAALMLRTRCSGEDYLNHLDLDDRVALLSVKRFLLLGPDGQELMALKYKHVSKAEVRQVPKEDNTLGWAIIIVLNTPRRNGSKVEVLACKNKEEAVNLCNGIKQGVDMVASDKT